MESKRQGKLKYEGSEDDVENEDGMKNWRVQTEDDVENKMGNPKGVHTDILNSAPTGEKDLMNKCLEIEVWQL